MAVIRVVPAAVKTLDTQRLQSSLHPVWRTKTAAALIASVLTLAACTTRGSYCDLTDPIRPANVDVLTDAEVAAILSHNEKGARLCNWEARP